MAERIGRDPWVVGGLILLLLASAGLVVLYRAGPQSVEQLRTSAWLSARPSSFEPHLARARSLADIAADSAAAGRDSSAVVGYAGAAAEAALAYELAADSAERSVAIEVWADATLTQARLYLDAGTGSGMRPDDNEMLEAALLLVNRVLGAPVERQALAEATTLRATIEQELRTGPLEWLPR